MNEHQAAAAVFGKGMKSASELTKIEYFAAHADLSAFKDEDGMLVLYLAQAVMVEPIPEGNEVAQAGWWARATAALRYSVAEAMIEASPGA